MWKALESQSKFDINIIPNFLKVNLKAINIYDLNWEVSMSVVKIIEVISQGKSIEEALQSAIHEASKTLHNIKQINVEHVSGIVENNKIVEFRINAKISFVVDQK
jgi:flavin-binding protein dodecin